MQVCAASRELRFFVNGVDQGVAYRDLPLDTPLYGAVSLYNKSSQIVYNVRGSVAHACILVFMFVCRVCWLIWVSYTHARALSSVFVAGFGCGFGGHVADIATAQRQTNFNLRHHGH